VIRVPGAPGAPGPLTAPSGRLPKNLFAIPPIDPPGSTSSPARTIDLAETLDLAGTIDPAAPSQSTTRSARHQAFGCDPVALVIGGRAPHSLEEPLLAGRRAKCHDSALHNT
jgi:hypothetical protein